MDEQNNSDDIKVNPIKDDIDYSGADTRKTTSQKNNPYDIKLFSTNYEFAYLNNSRVSKVMINNMAKFNEKIDDYRYMACLTFLCGYANKHNVLCRKTERENMPLSRKEIEDIGFNSTY